MSHTLPSQRGLTDVWAGYRPGACFQNTLLKIDIDDPRGVGIGSMTNLPAWVGESPALVSFLLYLPRVWYNLAQMQYTAGQTQHMRVGGNVLLGLIARHLAVPLYQMPHGGAAFWSFLDFLTTTSNLEPPRDEARKMLLYDDCDGYKSWFANLLRGHRADSPEWYHAVVERNKSYYEYGASAMVNLRIGKEFL